ncbi:hypothetical protein BZA70DRAFT_290988 [Myxozyma melibiosi]|uniref:Uncharacterized protein n=1 Tax=Myxozyma melibiosi TaxID=54550 RepID=A0ABR1F452_9ASCO
MVGMQNTRLRRERLTVLIVDTASYLRIPMTSIPILYSSPMPHERFLSAISSASLEYAPSTPAPAYSECEKSDLCTAPSKAPQIHRTSARECVASWSYRTMLYSSETETDVHAVSCALASAGTAGVLSAIRLWNPALVLVRVPCALEEKRVESRLEKVFRLTRGVGVKTAVVVDARGGGRKSGISFSFESRRKLARVRDLAEMAWHSQRSSSSSSADAPRRLTAVVELEKVEELHEFLYGFTRRWVARRMQILRGQRQGMKVRDTGTRSLAAKEEGRAAARPTTTTTTTTTTTRLERWSLRNEVRMCETTCLPLFYVTSNVQRSWRRAARGGYEIELFGHAGCLQVNQSYLLGPCSAGSRGELFAQVKIKQILSSQRASCAAVDALEPVKVRVELTARPPNLLRAPKLLWKPYIARGARIIQQQPRPPTRLQSVLLELDRRAADDLCAGSDATLVYAGRHERAAVIFWADTPARVAAIALPSNSRTSGLIPGESVGLLDGSWRWWGVGGSVCVGGRVVAESPAK